MSQKYASIYEKLQNLLFLASHCFPIEKVGRQDSIDMIARPSINKDIKLEIRGIR